MNNTLKTISDWHNVLTETLDYNGGQVSHKLARRLPTSVVGVHARTMKQDGQKAAESFGISRELRKSADRKIARAERLKRLNPFPAMVPWSSTARDIKDLRDRAQKNRDIAKSSQHFGYAHINRGQAAKAVANGDTKEKERLLAMANGQEWIGHYGSL